MAVKKKTKKELDYLKNKFHTGTLYEEIKNTFGQGTQIF